MNLRVPTRATSMSFEDTLKLAQQWPALEEDVRRVQSTLHPAPRLTFSAPLSNGDENLHWSAQEVAALRRLWPRVGAVRREINRPISAIEQKARRLGLRRR